MVNSTNPTAHIINQKQTVEVSKNPTISPTKMPPKKPPEIKCSISQVKIEKLDETNGDLNNNPKPQKKWKRQSSVTRESNPGGLQVGPKRKDIPKGMRIEGTTEKKVRIEKDNSFDLAVEAAKQPHRSS